jgi:hypothetical protein
MAFSPAWDEEYARAYPEEFAKFSPAHPSVAGLKEGESRTFGGELTPNSERRF